MTKIKRVLVLGANGRVGAKVVHELTKQRYQVNALIYGDAIKQRSDLVTYFQGDVYDKQSLREALTGCDAVISTLGSWGTKGKDILTVGMEHIVPLMQEQKINRIVTLTGADAYANGDSRNPIHRIMHAILSLTASKVLKDGENHITVLQRSSLNWTTLRSPIMNQIGNPENFKLTSRRPLPTATINRESVALAIVDLIEDSSRNKQAPFISRR